MSDFFSSRWIGVPEHATMLAEAAALPRGFRAAGVSCGLKPNGSPDLAIMVCDSEEATSAARFTRSGTLAAPVLLNLERARLGNLRAVVVNSGNANAATGVPGLENALEMAETTAEAARLPVETVAVASTGVIGVPLPMDRVRQGIARAAAELRPAGWVDFAEAIRTTDACAKRVCLDVELEGGTVRLCAQAKGAGMISPGFATLLVFIQSDARLSPATCDLLLGVTVRRSFERVSVDGQLSTSDTVVLQCSGASGVAVEPETPDELRFGETLDAVLRQLALMVVSDGEGARRVGRVHVRGGDEAAVHAVARAVANSPLVKTALYGGDPNWGRIVQAVGMALPGTAPLALDIAIEGVTVCERGAFKPHDAEALTAAVRRREVEYAVDLPGQGAETEMFFSDLGHEYVTINAEYTT